MTLLSIDRYIHLKAKFLVGKDSSKQVFSSLKQTALSSNSNACKTFDKLQTTESNTKAYIDIISKH